jgi:hypothetical protein
MSGKTKYLPNKDHKLMCGHSQRANCQGYGRSLCWRSTPRLEINSLAQIL